MHVVVDGGSADVHRDPVRVARLEGLELPVQVVVEAQVHGLDRGESWSLASPPFALNENLRLGFSRWVFESPRQMSAWPGSGSDRGGPGALAAPDGDPP